MVTLVRLLQEKNAPIPMLVTELGMVTLVRPLQPRKASLPILVTELGMTVFIHPVIKVFEALSIIALQLSRESYIALLASTTIEVKPLQFMKAPLPMLVTLLPIVTEVRLVHPLKA